MTFHTWQSVALASAMLAVMVGGELPVQADQTHTLVDDGAWCWFQDPRALRHGNTTYVNYVTTGGDIRISAFDHTTRQIRHAVLHANLEADDHNDGGILILPDGRIMTFYSRHNDTAGVRYRISLQPGSIAAWGREQVIPGSAAGGGATYSNPIMLSGEQNRIYVFYRNPSRYPSVSWTDDCGATWSSSVQYISNPLNRYPYVQVASTGESKVHILWTDTHPRRDKPGIYDNKHVNYMYYEDKGSGAAFYQADDTLIRTMADVMTGSPIVPGEADVVFTSAGDHRSWNWDIVANANDQPVALVVDISADPEEQHDYYYAVFNGSAWQTHFIVNGGARIGDIEVAGAANCYGGGMSLDPADPCTVYASRQVSPDAWTMEKWTTPDQGMTWSRVALLNSPSSKNVRPVAVNGAVKGEEIQVVWMQGRYNAYIDYDTALAAWPMTAPAQVYTEAQSVPGR